jgi:hypothetical protein
MNSNLALDSWAAPFEKHAVPKEQDNEESGHIVVPSDKRI